ncbi:MAG TPA: hypothetical protein VEC16_00530 [Alphaproteobacteria bacterium]|nr:hypothetical protein [Alphaproteobacteria bacterium]
MSASPFKDVLDAESNSMKAGIKSMELKLNSFAENNKSLNEYKKILYTHLLSYHYDGPKAKQRITPTQFYVIKEGLKTSIPRQMRLFARLKETISQTSKDIATDYHKYSHFQTLAPFRNFTEHSQKINFELMQDIDTLVNILDVELKAIKKIEDIQTLNEVFRQSGEHKHLGTFGRLKLSLGDHNKEQVYYAKDFISFFEQERALYKKISNYVSSIKEAEAKLNLELKNVSYKDLAEIDNVTVAAFRATKGMGAIAAILSFVAVALVGEVSLAAAGALGIGILIAVPIGLVYALVNTTKTYKTADKDVLLLAESLAKKLQNEVRNVIEKTATFVQQSDLNISVQAIPKAA